MSTNLTIPDTSSRANAPIFVVGASRSGTSLLAAMLNAHSRIACGPESQLLNKLKPSALQKILKDSAWPNEAVERMSKIELAEQYVIDLFNVDKNELRHVLQQREPSIAALFDALIGTYTAKQNKPRWAEKTPRHLLHLDTLRQAFPHAHIIRIVRDFRDSALSMCQLPWASREPLINGYICCEWYEKTDPFFSRDTNCLTVRYEQMVKNPEVVLAQICAFIGEEFELSMLDTSQSGSAVISANELWKQQVTGKLDKSRLYRWKSHFTAEQNRVFEFLAGRWLQEFDYAVSQQPLCTYALLSFERKLLEREISQIVDLANKGIALIHSNNPLTPQPAIINFHNALLKDNRRVLYKILLIRRCHGYKTLCHVGDGLRSNLKRTVLRVLFNVNVLTELSELAQFENISE